MAPPPASVAANGWINRRSVGFKPAENVVGIDPSLVLKPAGDGSAADTMVAKDVNGRVIWFWLAQ
jgi:hypothetical protein